MHEREVSARRYAADDGERLVAGLRRAAASARSAQAVRSAENARWRYASAPDGAEVAFALDAGGRALAGIAGTRRRALLEGTEVAFLEIGDVFNDFEQRPGLARARALLAAGAAFAETFGGPAPEKCPVMYGLPDRRAHRIGLRRLEWEVLRSENELRAPLGSLPALPAPEIALEEAPRFPPEVADLFRGFAASRPAILVRDRAVLDWRYAEHPEREYAIGLARRAGELAGYAVYHEGWLHDWIVPPGVASSGDALLAWAAGRARDEGRSALSVSVPDTAPEWLVFQERGFRAVGARGFFAFRSFQRPAIMSWLFKHWYYTRGDVERR